MEGCRTSNKCLIVDRHVTGEKHAVRDDHAVSNFAIVTEMNSGHQKILVTDHRT